MITRFCLIIYHFNCLTEKIALQSLIGSTSQIKVPTVFEARLMGALKVVVLIVEKSPRIGHYHLKMES